MSFAAMRGAGDGMELFVDSKLWQGSEFSHFPAPVPLSPTGRPNGAAFLKEDEDDAAVVSCLGYLSLAADHPGKYRIGFISPAGARTRAAGPAAKAEAGTMKALPFVVCLAICALGGMAVGAIVGNANSGLTTGLAAGAAIASVFILLGGKTT